MKNKKAFGVMVALLMFLSLPCNVSAGIQTGGFATGKLSYRVECDTNFASLATVRGYVQRWNNISSKVALTYTTSYTSSQIAVIYMKYDGPDSNTIGETSYYLNGNRVSNAVTRTGAVCSVYRNEHTLQNTSEAKAVAYASCVHEVGHALSLSHSSKPDDVLYTPNRTVTMPTSSDKSFLKSKWGN